MPMDFSYFFNKVFSIYLIIRSCTNNNCNYYLVSFSNILMKAAHIIWETSKEGDGDLKCTPGYTEIHVSLH